MRNFFFICSLVCGISLQTLADSPASEYWQRDTALAAARSFPVERMAREIGDVSTLSDAAYVLAGLKRLESRADWPVPAREAALHRFARSLADLPRDAVAAEVMRYLHAYRSRTLVPHEDQADAFVPLFNVSAAAQGVENAWQREEASMRGARLLADDPKALVTLFAQSSDDNQRNGYIDTLGLAGVSTASAVQYEALRQLAGNADVSPLLAAAVLVTGDRSALRELLAKGRGPGLAAALQAFGPNLGVRELSGMLEYAVMEAPAANASLAIAAWWPRLRHDAVTRELLLALLADSSLGSSAALALSSRPDVLTIKALQEMAASDTPAALRARRALDLNRERAHGEVQP